MTTTTRYPRTYTALCGASAASDTFDNGVMYAYGLTSCCEASGKGNADSPTGVVCRGCYKVVSAKYGSHGWESIREAARDAKCPCPDECADYMLSVVMGDHDA